MQPGSPDFRSLLAISRRGLIKGAGAAVATASLASVTSRSFAADKQLNVLCWSGHGDEYQLKPFEDKYGVKVVTKEYVGGEQMLALINQSPPGTFDVVLADAEYIGMLRDGNFIDPLTPSDYHLGDYWPEFQKFEPHWVGDKLYSVMLRFGYIGLAYRSDLLTAEEVGSYKILWDPKTKGRVGLYDWYLPCMGSFSLYEGNKPPFDIDAARFDQLKAKMFTLKPQVAGFLTIADCFSTLKNGSTMVMPGVGDWLSMTMAKDGAPVTSIVPKEGGMQWTESLSICSASPSKDLAKSFIQYMTSPEGQILTARLPAYWASIPNKKAWEVLNEKYPTDAKILRHELGKPNVMDEYKEGKIFIRKTPVQQSIEDWNDAWTKFKSL